MSLAALINQLICWVKDLGWIGVFMGVILESIIIPIPSPLIPMGAGFILIPYDKSIIEVLLLIFVIIAFVGSIAATLGSYLGYYIGYFGGKLFITKYGKYLGVNWREIEEAARDVCYGGRRRAILLFLSRAAPVVPLSLISFVAGILRVDVKEFTIWTFIGCIPRYFILGLLGWLVGVAYSELSMILESTEMALTIIIIILLCLYFVYKRFFKDKWRVIRI